MTTIINRHGWTREAKIGEEIPLKFPPRDQPIESDVLAALTAGAGTNLEIREWLKQQSRPDFSSQQIYYAVQRLRKAGMVRKTNGRWTEIKRAT